VFGLLAAGLLAAAAAFLHQFVIAEIHLHSLPFLRFIVLLIEGTKAGPE
jgi:hypothetical protein